CMGRAQAGRQQRRTAPAHSWPRARCAARSEAARQNMDSCSGWQARSFVRHRDDYSIALDPVGDRSGQKAVDMLGREVRTCCLDHLGKLWPVLLEMIAVDRPCDDARHVDHRIGSKPVGGHVYLPLMRLSFIAANAIPATVLAAHPL